MKYLVLIAVGIYLLYPSDKPVNVVKVQPVIAEAIVFENRELPKAIRMIQPRDVVVKDVSPQEFVMILSDDPEWEKEMYDLLTMYEPENAQAIFQDYVNERQRYKDEVSLSLQASVAALSDLNGQSGFGKVEQEVKVADLERNHAMKVRSILGDHYEFIHEQYLLTR